jgi:hypothetical protein
MSVLFEEDQGYNRKGFGNNNNPKMVQWLIDKGIVKGPKQANIMLLIIAVVAIGISVYMWLPEQTNAPASLSETEKQEIRLQSGFNELPEELQRALLGE